MESVQSPAQTAAGIEVRLCHTLAEYEDCLRLEQITWGTGILVPTAIFVVAQETGGQIIGAFDKKEMIGFTMALAAIHEGRPSLHSHMTAVLEPYRDKGVGRALKLFQRQEALSRKIHLVEWTYDPLELKNARFNLMRLGAIIRRHDPQLLRHHRQPAPQRHAHRSPGSRMVARFTQSKSHSNRRIAGSGLTSKEFTRVSIPNNISDLRTTIDQPPKKSKRKSANNSNPISQTRW